MTKTKESGSTIIVGGTRTGKSLILDVQEIIVEFPKIILFANMESAEIDDETYRAALSVFDRELIGKTAIYEIEEAAEGNRIIRLEPA